MTTTYIIQIVSLVVIAFSSVFYLLNLIQQKKFHVYSFRPWLFIKPKREIEITDESFKIYAYLVNIGKTPALNGITVTEITNTEEYPLKELRGKLIKSNEGVDKGVVFPGDESAGVVKESHTDPSGAQLPDSRDGIINTLLNSDFYIHYYTEYSDNRTVYALRITWVMGFKKVVGKNAIAYNAANANISHKRIR